MPTGWDSLTNYLAVMTQCWISAVRLRCPMLKSCWRGIRKSQPAKISASLEGGSFDTFNQTLGVSGSAGRFRYAFDLAHFRSGDTPVTPLGLLAEARRLGLKTPSESVQMIRDDRDNRR